MLLRLFLLLAISAPAFAAPVPPDIDTLLRDATPKERAVIAKVAKRTTPDSSAEIDALVAALDADSKTAQRAAAKIQAKEKKQLAAKSPEAAAPWKGEAALGGSFSTGNTEQIGFSSSVALAKRDPDWEQNLNLSFDYLRSDGRTQRERIYASYQARRDLGTNWFFAFGLASFERDRFAGIDRRFTESAGLGYRLSDSDAFKLTVEGGPALRQTKFTDGRDLNKADFLGRSDIHWKVSDSVQITEAAGFVLSSGNSSFFSKSALTASLVNNLALRTSLDILHETDPPLGRQNTDTITRASLVYGF